MAKVYETLEERHVHFIDGQHVLFVATPPLSADGQVNLSPKGLDTFRVLGPRQVAWLDLTGSEGWRPWRTSRRTGGSL